MRKVDSATWQGSDLSRGKTDAIRRGLPRAARVLNAHPHPQPREPEGRSAVQPPSRPAAQPLSRSAAQPLSRLPHGESWKSCIQTKFHGTSFRI